MTKVVSLFRLVIYPNIAWSKLVTLFSTCYFLNVKVAFFFHFLLAGYRLVFEEVLNSRNRILSIHLEYIRIDHMTLTQGVYLLLCEGVLNEQSMHDKYLTACADNKELHLRTLFICG